MLILITIFVVKWQYNLRKLTLVAQSLLSYVTA